MKKISTTILIFLATVPIFAENGYSLEECRQMALEHNKSLQIARENVKAANELKKAAFAQFLPNFGITGTYTWNQKNLSLLSEDALLPVGVKDQNGKLGTGITATSVPTPNADGTFSFTESSISNEFKLINGSPVPLDAKGVPFDPAKNPEKLIWKNYALLPKSAMEFDIQNVFTGTIGFTQPIYMGGKIRELYKIAKYGKNLAMAQEENKTTDLLLDVDEAYWRVVSVENKLNLAKEYQKLLAKMDSDVTNMIQEGVATKADGLKVKVKLNEANVMVTKAENGLSLSRMALNQLCGIPLEQATELADDNFDTPADAPQLIPIAQALEKRPEIKALTQMENIAKSNERIMVSRFLPTVGLTGGYMVSNPNVYNGYTNEFGGMFTFSVVAHVPLFHFGDKIHTLNASKTQRTIAGLQLDEAKEKIQLQIQQNSYKVAESLNKKKATSKNIEQAKENLKCATDGFEEGVITSTDLIGAQTAWLSAKSEDIDAEIDVRLCKLYLEKSLGTLEVPEYKQNSNKNK
ncbi:MAG: TolC family protein [Paludibacter sp.]|nr:TolC family protein [Paludibacter sp.]